MIGVPLESLESVTTLEQLASYFEKYYSKNSSTINARVNTTSWNANDKAAADDINAVLKKIASLCKSLPQSIKRNDYGMYRLKLESKIIDARQQMEATLQAYERYKS